MQSQGAQPLHQIVIRMCDYINQHRHPRRVKPIIHGAQVLGLPMSPQFNLQRHLYNLSLAAVNIMMDEAAGFQLATIFLKNLVVDCGYWDVLHFCYDLKDDIKIALAGALSGLHRAHDLNAGYRCLCADRRAVGRPSGQVDEGVRYWRGGPRRTKDQITIQEAGQYEQMCGRIGRGRNRDGKENPPFMNLNLGGQGSGLVDFWLQGTEINVDAELIDLEEYGRVEAHREGEEEEEGDAQGVMSEQESSVVLIQGCGRADGEKSDKLVVLLDQDNEMPPTRAPNNNPASLWSTVEQIQHRVKQSLGLTQPTQLPTPASTLQPSRQPTPLRCHACLQVFHPGCQNNQALLCSKCYLKENSIKFRAVSCLVTGYTHQTGYLTVMHFDCPDVASAKVDYSDSYLVEMRVQVMDSFGHNYKYEEGQSGVGEGLRYSIRGYQFYINCQPMQFKTSLACGEVVSVRLPIKLLEETNTLVVENTNRFGLSTGTRMKGKTTKQSPSALAQNLLIGIYKVVPRGSRKQIITNTVTQLPPASIRAYYRSLPPGTPIRYSLLSPSTGKPIAVPVRSFQCRHAECFDYQDVSVALTRERNSVGRGFRLRRRPGAIEGGKKRAPRGVHCPVCGVKMNGLYIDALVLGWLQRWGREDGRKKSHPIIFEYVDQQYESVQQQRTQPQKLGSAANRNNNDKQFRPPNAVVDLELSGDGSSGDCHSSEEEQSSLQFVGRAPLRGQCHMCAHDV